MNNIKKFSFLRFAACLVISLGAGALGALLAGGDFAIYSALNLPPPALPPVVFIAVWTVLYILMGIASYLVLQSAAEDTKNALMLYGAYLIANILWPPLFFGMQAFLAAFFLICGQILLIIACFSAYRKINTTAAWLIFPVIIWSFFALYLNGGVLFLN